MTASQSKKVYDALRRDISSLYLRPGSRLHEEDLGELYKASRTPIREALLRLHHEGFVERDGRILRVKRYTFPDVLEIYQFREALESAAVRLCVERASDNDLKTIEDQIHKYLEFNLETDRLTINSYANLFHRSLASLCGNKLIDTNLQTIYDKVMVISDLYWDMSSVEKAHHDHLRILHTIRKRDMRAAEEATRNHIRHVIQIYQENLDTPETG